MKVAYPTAYYHPDHTSGGNAHVRQFIENAVSLGHELWTPREVLHPATKQFPHGRINRLMLLRSMDVIYVRVEDQPNNITGYALSPYRQLLGSPLMVWEFNTVPEYGKVIGKNDEDINRAIALFRNQGKGCDLAICVSKSIAKYVHENLMIENIITIPNASDPDKFNPQVSPVKNVEHVEGKLNVVWIGSADLSWHDFSLMVDAARLLWNCSKRNRISFHIIGQNLQGTREMPPNIHYHGAEKYDYLPNWLVAMDVGLVLYHAGPGDYSSPLKLFDYMASGLAVVSSEQPQVRDILKEIGQEDLLLTQRSPDALVKILLNLADNIDKVRQYGKAGRQLIIKKYNWRKAVGDSFNAIKNILQQKYL